MDVSTFFMFIMIKVLLKCYNIRHKADAAKLEFENHLIFTMVRI
jgi:hypothetical protein